MPWMLIAVWLAAISVGIKDGGLEGALFIAAVLVTFHGLFWLVRR
jgi:hypothetical protein